MVLTLGAVVLIFLCVVGSVLVRGETVDRMVLRAHAYNPQNAESDSDGLPSLRCSDENDSDEPPDMASSSSNNALAGPDSEYSLD